MIQLFINNSISFLIDLAAWLVTPVPLIFVVLFIMGQVFYWVRCLTSG